MTEASMAGWWVGLLASAKARIEALGLDLASAPADAQRALESTHSALMSAAGVRGATYVVILLFIGIAVEWLYWTYAYSSLRAVTAAPVTSPLQALQLGVRRLMLQASGLLLFTAATIGASAAFAWPPRVHELVIAATLFLLVLRLSWIGISIVLAPRRPQLRLVPVRQAHARWLAAALMAVLALLAVGRFLAPVLEGGAAQAPHVANALRLASFSAAALLLFVTVFAFFGRPRGRPAGGPAMRAPLFPKSFPLALLIVAVYAVWLMHDHAAAVAAIVAAAIALQLGLREMVFFYWRDEENGGEREGGALPVIVLSLSRFVAALAGLGAAALALDTPLATLTEELGPWARVSLRLLSVAVLALLAHGVWIAVRSVVDQRLASIGPVDPHEPPDASSRLLTLLPLLRVTAAVLLLVMLVLSSLWALGIEITPLLAGAGVLGVALGFGAQSLVRDVIAGIFYLADDAFRVGEYIEGGGNSKGNVERITLRSVALRHHNGPLHFVPYGALGSVRNTSRDWVIDKFNLPLPIDVESEKIRKMIKKVGEDMKEETAIGQHILEPLKGKLYRIDPGVKIFRCKFRSPPGKQFDIRAAALRRIEAALKEMGVRFADGVSTVVVKG
ncbi:MAG TPA: mechanosensitive ion channel domain-containing protein [Burkholderiales bacterium]|jgi:small-conductance mechanosensitive channel